MYFVGVRRADTPRGGADAPSAPVAEARPSIIPSAHPTPSSMKKTSSSDKKTPFVPPKLERHEKLEALTGFVIPEPSVS